MKIEKINRYLSIATAAMAAVTFATAITALSLKRDLVQVCQSFYTRSPWQKGITALASGQTAEEYIAQENICAQYGSVQNPVPE